jgi:hypothetical protein
MELKYQLTEPEYVYAQMQFATKITHPTWLRLQTATAWIALLASGFILCVTAIRGPAENLQDAAFDWFILFFSLFLLAERYFLGPRRARRVYRTSPNTSAERHLLIDENGLKLEMREETSEMRWGAFQRAHELRDVFLLMYGPKSFYIVPKRVLVPDLLDQFRSLLLAKGLLSTAP